MILRCEAELHLRSRKKAHPLLYNEGSLRGSTIVYYVLYTLRTTTKPDWANSSCIPLFFVKLAKEEVYLDK